MDARGFCHFHSQAARIDAAPAHDFAEIADQRWLVDHLSRKIDAHLELRIADAERGMRADRLFNHPIGQSIDASGPFGLEDEFVGRDRSPLRVVPANQRLGPGHRVRTEIPLRLIRQPDFAIAQAIVDPRMKRQVPRRIGQPRGFEAFRRPPVGQSLARAGKCAIDACVGIERTVAIEAEVHVGIEGVIADAERRRKQRLQPIQMIELRIKWTRFLGPGELPALAMIDLRRF